MNPSSSHGRSIELACRLISESLASMPLPSHRPFTLADFGCGEGRNSIGVSGVVLSALRERSPGHPALVILEDRPTNDFHGLFANVYPGGARDAGLGDPTWLLVSAESFQASVLPPATLDFGVSFASLHYLSRVPEVRQAEAISASLLEGQSAEPFRAQAAADWETFLARRAAELAPGGRLLLFLGGRDERGASGDAFYRAMSEELRLMAATGRIDRARLGRFVLPLYFRTEEELRAPLEGPLGDQFEVETLLGDDSLFFEERLARGDAEGYAEAAVALIRGWSEVPLASALFQDPASTEATAALDAFYQALHDRFVADPGAHPIRSVVWCLLLARKAARTASPPAPS